MMKSIEEYDCEDLRPYCPWEGSPIAGPPNSMCEGRFCEEAYERMIEDQENE